MARIEWVKQRLENWARWHERAAGGGLGFASQSSFLKDVDSSRYREAWVPVDEVEAGVTDKGVATLRASGRSHLYRTLELIYLKGVGIKVTARSIDRAESTVHAHLEQADAWLSEWFGERKRLQAEQRARVEQVIRTSA